MGTKARTQILKTVLVFGFITSVIYLSMMMVGTRMHLKNRRIILQANPGLARTGGQEYFMTRDFNINEAYDMVVIGTSHAYRGYDPRFFKSRNLNLYNLGSSSQHPIISLKIMQDMVVLLPKKPFIIVDLFDKLLEMDGDESAGRMIVNCKDQNMARHILIDNPTVLNVNNYCARLMANEVPFEVETNDYVMNGYCSKDHVWSGQIPPVDYVFQGNDETISDLVELLDWLEEHAYEYVMVSHPMPQQNGFSKYHAPARALLLNLAATRKRHFFDFTDHPDFHYLQPLFADPTHLNQAGVDLFNRILLDSLYASGLVLSNR
jgi:hypothetical protein